MVNSKTLVVVTGGTIEAMYDPKDGTPSLVPLPKSAEDSAIPAALERLGLRGHCDILPVAMKDSKEVITAHLDHILAHVAEHGYDKIVIVHGTDTMPLHAQYLKRQIAEYGSWGGMNEKRFVLTGAMYPLRYEDGTLRPGGEKNDGPRNLAMAMKDVETVPAGVFVERGQGPQEADTIRKWRVTKKDETGKEWVEKSGFGQDDPARHKIERF